LDKLKVQFVERQELLWENVTKEQLSKVAAVLLEKCKSSTVFLLEGQLGAGKTSLVQALVRVLGCQQEATSPTFTLINEYSSAERSVFHMDLYRLKNVQEAEEIGLTEYLDSGSYCFIEWPDVAGTLLIPPFYKIALEVNGPETRAIKVSLYTEENEHANHE
jgi:tRNA threonylcarbamoyladenosine biosynthesis protein TsaE